MSESSEQNACDDILPVEAFALLGNEIRIDIIWALSETPDEPLTFSALRSRIDVPDSGQFNYHLSKLLGSFIRRDEGEYELTFAGTQLVGTIFSRSFNQRGDPLTIEPDSTCAICESVLLVEYERECVTISCPACDDLIASFGFPPGAFENRTTDDLARAFNTWIRSLLTATVNGFCLICTGWMRGSIIDNSEHFADQEVGTEHVCERCTERTVITIGEYLLYHPHSVAFHSDHGISLDETPFWELPWLREEEITILSRNPWRIRSIIELDGDRLEVVIEEDLFVSVV